MSIKELSIKDQIKFDLIELQKGQELKTNGNKIISVIFGKVKDKIKGTLESFESSVYHSGNIKALENTLLSVFDIKDLDIILNNINVDKDFGEYCRSNWKQLRELYDVEGFEKVDLYRGDQVEKEFNGEKYKFNLWFCGPKVDCLFHNQYNFIEVHTCVAGDGFMQKANDFEGKELIETVGLMPGTSHRKFNISGEFEENGNPKYPIHRWLGGKTGNIWLVIEKY